MEFLGYMRPDDSAGIRNYVLVVPGGLIADKICELVPGTKTIAMARSGAGMPSRAREVVARTLFGLARNPNVGGVILHSGLASGDYPELKIGRLASEIAKSGKPLEIIDIEAEGGSIEAITKGVKLARKMVQELSKLRREPVSIGKLCLGVKCGASDPTSGMVGNPVVGYLVDWVLEAGGTAMFGETTEIIGAEHILAKRAVNEEVAANILQTVRTVEERALATGEDIRTMNPVPENIAAGISSLEEKSLGAIYKTGHQPIQGVIQYAERPTKPGLYMVDTWMGNRVMFPGFAAAGTQLNVFQYGGGGATTHTLLDSPPLVAPLLWASANPRTYARAKDSLDFYSGTVIEGAESLEEAGERLLKLVIDVASGTLTRSETLNYSEPIEVYVTDPMF